MYLKITSGKVLVQSSGPDVIMLETELSEGMHPYIGNAIAEIKVAHNQGEKYIKENMPELVYSVVDFTKLTHSKFAKE